MTMPVMQWAPMVATAGTGEVANTPEILPAPAGEQERRERRGAHTERDSGNLRSLPPQQAAIRVVIRTPMEEKSDVLQQLMAQPLAIAAPTADAWNGLIAARREARS